MHLRNRKLVHLVEDVGISPWPVDMVEFSTDAYAHGKQVDINNYITRCHRQLELIRGSDFQSVGVRVAVGDRMPAGWEPAKDRGLGPSGPKIEQPSRMRKKCCYSQRNLWSICGSLSPSPTQLSHITNINPFTALSQLFRE